MGHFFGFIFGLWIVGTFVTWPYFWAKRTTPGDNPRARRFKALGIALIWPVQILKWNQARAQQTKLKADAAAAEARILGSGPLTPSAGPIAPPTSSADQFKQTVVDPFETR